MSSKVSPALEFGLEVLNVLKTRELTRAELAVHFDVSEASVWRVLAVLVRKGFVREREATTGYGDGRKRMLYAAKAWSGAR